MNCEEFATAGLDLGSAEAESPLQQLARAHLSVCPHCAALHENWQTLRINLRDLGAETLTAEASPRVEMRLRQEFRTKHKTLRSYRVAAFAGWGLAAAAVLLGTFSWLNWNYEKKNPQVAGGTTTSEMNATANAHKSQVAPAGPELGETLVAS